MQKLFRTTQAPHMQLPTYKPGFLNFKSLTGNAWSILCEWKTTLCWRQYLCFSRMPQVLCQKIQLYFTEKKIYLTLMSTQKPPAAQNERMFSHCLSASGSELLQLPHGRWDKTGDHWAHFSKAAIVGKNTSSKALVWTFLQVSQLAARLCLWFRNSVDFKTYFVIWSV